MKKIILITALFWLLSCDKDPSTTTPTTPINPYDSIHKKFMGNWIDRDGRDNISAKGDSTAYFRITYDTIFVGDYPTAIPSKAESVFLPNYRFFTSDSITGKYKNWTNKDDYKTRVIFYTNDSIRIKWIIPHSTTTLPYFYDQTLIRLK